MLRVVEGSIGSRNFDDLIVTACVMKKIACGFAFLAYGASALDNGLARTPPMGWMTVSLQAGGDQKCSNTRGF